VEPIVYVLIFVSTFLAAEGLFLLVGSRNAARRAVASRRLQRLASRLQAPDTLPGATLLRKTTSRGGFVEQLYRMLPGRSALELRLYRAGLSTTPARFFGFSVGLALAGFFAGLLIWSDPMIGLVGAAAGVVPWIRTGSCARKRMKRFEEQFPEALELMTRALRAGHSLMFAFQLVGEEMPDPIGSEFTHVSEEIKLGQELGVALSNLVYRINAGDLPYFTTAVMIQRETGGNLAELLDNLGYVIRDRFKLFGKVRSLTSVGKVTANILGAWPLLMVVMLSLVGADFVSLLWKTPAGHTLSVSGAILVVVGYVLCRRAAEIRV
jgi:tight adherence protein B